MFQGYDKFVNWKAIAGLYRGSHSKKQLWELSENSKFAALWEWASIIPIFHSQIYLIIYMKLNSNSYRKEPPAQIQNFWFLIFDTCLLYHYSKYRLMILEIWSLEYS